MVEPAKLEPLGHENSHTRSSDKKTILTLIKELTVLKRFSGVIISLLSALSFTCVDILIYDVGQSLHPAKSLLMNFIVMVILNIGVLIAARPNFPRDSQEVLYLILSGFCSGSGSVFLLLSVMITDPGNAVSLYFTLPLFIIVLNAILHREPPKLWTVVFAFISIAGVMFIVKPSFLFHENSSDKTINCLGVSLALIAAFCHGSHVLVVKRLTEFQTHNFYIMLLTSVIALVETLLLCIYFGILSFTESSEVAIKIFCSGVADFAGFSLLALAVTIEKPFIVTTLLTTEVVFTFIVQYLYLDLPLSWQSIVGGFLIGFSCISIKVIQRYQQEADDFEEPLLQ